MYLATDSHRTAKTHVARLVALAATATTLAAFTAGSAQARITPSPWGPPACPTGMTCSGGGV
jgi:hypothetical protein